MLKDKLIYAKLFSDKEFNGYKINSTAYYQDEKFIIYLYRNVIMN